MHIPPSAAQGLKDIHIQQMKHKALEDRRLQMQHRLLQQHHITYRCNTLTQSLVRRHVQVQHKCR
jgi:hypothetical protein